MKLKFITTTGFTIALTLTLNWASAATDGLSTPRTTPVEVQNGATSPAAPLNASVFCSAVGIGGLHSCSISVSGGQPPYTISWLFGPIYSDSSQALYRVCPVGGDGGADVIDSAGTRRTPTRILRCNGGYGGGL